MGSVVEKFKRVGYLIPNVDKRDVDDLARSLDNTEGMAIQGAAGSGGPIVVPGPMPTNPKYFRLAGETQDAYHWQGKGYFQYSDNGSTLVTQIDDAGYIFNEAGSDIDFRIEGDTDANLFTLDAGSDAIAIGGAVDASFKFASQVAQVIDVTATEALLVRKDADGGDVFIVDTTNARVGIGNAAPEVFFHAFYGSAGAVSFATGSNFVFEDSDNSIVSIVAPDNKYASVVFGSPSDSLGSFFQWQHDLLLGEYGTQISNGQLAFFTGVKAEAMRIDEDGFVGIGTNNPSVKFEVYEDDSLLLWTKVVQATGTNTRLIASWEMASASGDAEMEIRAHGSAYSETIFDNSATDSVMLMGLNDTLMAVGNYANAPLVFGTNNAEVARFEADGDFAIGAATASGQLHVDQSSATGAQPVLLLDQGDASEQAIKISYDGADVDMILLDLDVTGSPQLGWDESEDAFTLNMGLDVTGVGGIDTTYTETGTSTYTHNSFILDIAPSSNSASNYIGVECQAQNTGSNDLTGGSQIVGGKLFAASTTSGDSRRLFGGSFQAIKSGTGAVTLDAIGGYFRVVNSNATGAINIAYGIRIDNPLATGAITTQYGLSIDPLTEAGTNYAIKTNGGQVVFDQASATAAIPVLLLDQGDVSEQAIKISYSAADVDMILIDLDVTGSPQIGWDESADMFTFSKGVSIGGAPPTNASLLSIEDGITFKESSAPTADTNYGKVWTNTSNELWFQDGAGASHLLHGDAFSNIWFHSPNTVDVTISAQDALTQIDSFTVVGNEDDSSNVVGSAATNDLTLSATGGGEYEISYHGSVTATGGADKDMMIAFGITLATPKDITDVTDDTVTPIVITSTAHGLKEGDMVQIVGVLGNTAANGSFIVDNETANTFEITAIDGAATTGNGDFDAGSPTGDVTIEYPGNMVVHRMVRGADPGAISATGLHILSNSDVLALYVANLVGTTNLTVLAVSLDANRIGD